MEAARGVGAARVPAGALGAAEDGDAGESSAPGSQQEEVFGFSAGEGAEVWSNSRGEWLPCLVQAVFPREVEAGGFTVPPNTIKVDSEAGTKYIREDSILQELRKTAGQPRRSSSPAGEEARGTPPPEKGGSPLAALAVGLGAEEPCPRTVTTMTVGSANSDGCAGASSATAAGDRSSCRGATDKDVSNCPKCGAPFTAVFRRHHCRRCGGLVCDDCSRSFVRLPQHQGKVRVCDGCARRVREGNAADVEEELAGKDEVISKLRAMLSEKAGENEGFKRALRELEEHVSGSPGPAERPAWDPESFENLLDRARKSWDSLLKAQADEEIRNDDLTVRQRQCLGHLAEAASRHEALLARRGELYEEVAELNRLEGDRDRLVRAEQELQRRCAEARGRLQELERQRQERLTRHVRRRRGCWSSQPPDPRGGELTISIVEDPSLRSPSQAEEGGRACALM